MRITREILHKVARESVEKYARRDRGLACIYLTGSLLTENPLLGGTTDIDLVFIHTSEPPYPREIVRLNDEIHLDIAHFSQGAYHQPRRLREDPWLGTFLVENPICLFDTAHWFEFTQASAGSQFNSPEYISTRARKLDDDARRSWQDLNEQGPDGSPAQVKQYLTCLENAANSVSMLNGVPLTERRFILQFPERAAAAGAPGLAPGLIDLFVPGESQEADPDLVKSLRSNWESALKAAGEVPDGPPRLAPARHTYFTLGVDALLEEEPAAALWLILRTWTDAVACLPPDSDLLADWRSACQQLSLSAADKENRCQSLDAYLDVVEETLDRYSQENGL
jgi:hypothetical protein